MKRNHGTGTARRLLGRVAGAAVAGALAIGLASAPAVADYPDRPIRVIVSYPAGGTGDLVARLTAAGLSEQLGVNVVVENRGGASGAIGATAVMNEAPDGYTLLATATATFAIVPHMGTPPYDPVTDFTSIAKIVDSRRVLAVHPSVPAETVEELVEYARANPGVLNFGSPGVGSTVQIITEMFNRNNDIEMTHVPFSGAAPALTDLLAGRIHVMIDTVVIPHVESGALRGLAVLGDQRLADLPDLPTLEEAGLPEMHTHGWNGLFGPANLPPEVVDRLSEALEALFQDEAFLDGFISRGLEPAYRGPEAFAAEVRDDYTFFGEVIRDLGITAE